MSGTTLPIADKFTVRAQARIMVRRHRRELIIMLTLYALASVASLVAPYVIGVIVNDATAKKDQLTNHNISALVLVLLISSLLYAVLQLLARRRSYILGERV